MATFEVFLKKDGRDEFRHVGALDAANDELALVSARECYVRRGEGDRLWVIRRDNILSPMWTHLGIGITDPVEPGPYWTQNFVRVP